MQNTRSHKGFTLIELLVVVAIIGILSTIVLAALGSARSRAKDASIQASMSQVRAQAEIYATGSSTGYTGMDSTSNPDNVVSLLDGATQQGATGASCTIGGTNGASYTCVATLTGGSTEFCVDSNGFAGVPTGTVSAGTQCQ